MSLPDFRSSLADHLRQFLQFKQALNRKYRTEAAALRLFDGYLCNHNVADWKAIDSAMIDDFLKSRPRTRPRSYNHLLGVLHRFFAFAIMQQWTRQNPVTARPRRNTGTRIPYLFDLRDAEKLARRYREAFQTNLGHHDEAWFMRWYSLSFTGSACALAKSPDSNWATPISSRYAVHPRYEVQPKADSCRWGPDWRNASNATSRMSWKYPGSRHASVLLHEKWLHPRRDN